jgi:methyl-accepting chemotaxis protein
MGEIAAASTEQSRGIEQVNQAITQMDEVTQQNAALVEEASASARSLEEQAGGLVSAVAQYSISGEPSAPAAAPRAAAPVVAARKPVVAAKAPVRGVSARPAAKPAAAPVKRNGANGHHTADKSDEQWAEF